MKRTPLNRKTGLKANKSLKATKTLQTKTQLSSKTRIKFRSKRMEKIYVERRELVSRILQERPQCEIAWDSHCYRNSTEVHERLARSVGGKIVGDSEDAYVATCHYCHAMVTDNPAEAHRRGWVVRSWERD